MLITLANYTDIQAQVKYSGSVTLQGLSQEVKVYFDQYGIPHIYAQSEKDAYFALGYIHAQERLAQLELYRRLGTGRFAEMVGKAGIVTDKMVRTVGITENAKRSAKILREGGQTRFRTMLEAYLAGVNTFVDTGKPPLEFEIMGVKKEKFTLEDIYAVTGFLSFQLALGFRSEMVIHQIRQKLGDKYLKDLNYRFGTPITPATRAGLQKGALQPKGFRGQAPIKNEGLKSVRKNTITKELAASIQAIPGVPTWLGSNAWVLSGQKTKKGQVIFCNDAHMGVGQPGFWYEVHLNYPGENLYGYVHALNPTFILGHNSQASFGNTSLLVDDMDFYQEQYQPQSRYKIKQDNQWINLTLRQETIKVKGGEDVKLLVKSTQRGPIINDVLPALTKEDQPISMFWVYNKFPNTLLKSSYDLSLAKTPQEAQKAASQLVSPSFNMMYGDKNGNIAWFASARLIKRRPGINSKFLLDGTSTRNEPLGYYDFSKNPQSINPKSGYVATANNQPDKVDGQMFPGYYVAGVRQQRFMDLFNTKKKWSNQDLQDLFMDDTSPLFVKISKEVLAVLKGDPVLRKSANHRYAAQLLRKWDGSHGLRAQAPVVFTKLLYYLIKNTMQDELGEQLFKELMPNPGFMNEVLSRTYPTLFFKDKSIWWNDVTTNEGSESRKDIFAKSYDQTIQELTKQLPETNNWRWGKVHQVTYINFTQDKRFTVGPFEMSGSIDVINKFGFALTNNAVYQISDQPSQRMLVDFSDREKRSWGILPVGNSGHPRSIFYQDQAKMYNKGKMRRQLTNKKEIQRSGSLLLLKVK
ncbi:penicillin acylase family protein [Microscilla marina]|uniref:Penicillin amidase superfamily n=1 Tax=Microscilla marina ATCC 23134 TaxID=313606 RepID=A1ZPV6_MICM2|nr:penicillin acylase family protein [Microscilla marina]EAY27611.1 penicillin amidase superfamily [Microscilla marina ATCC 23134]